MFSTLVPMSVLVQRAKYLSGQLNLIRKRQMYPASQDIHTSRLPKITIQIFHKLTFCLAGFGIFFSRLDIAEFAELADSVDKWFEIVFWHGACLRGRLGKKIEKACADGRSAGFLDPHSNPE
jgi:hypothetical protein